MSDLNWLLPSGSKILQEDINADLQRLDADVLVTEIKQAGPYYPEAMEITYVDKVTGGEQGVLIGTMLTQAEYHVYEDRHTWTMEIALAIDIVMNPVDCRGDCGGDCMEDEPDSEREAD